MTLRDFGTLLLMTPNDSDSLLEVGRYHLKKLRQFFFIIVAIIIAI